MLPPPYNWVPNPIKEEQYEKITSYLLSTINRKAGLAHERVETFIVAILLGKVSH